MLGAYPDIQVSLKECVYHKITLLVWQDLVVKELREALGEKKTLDMSDVSKLKYLEMCIKETMRLYPVAPFIFRDTSEDFQLDKITIPRHVTVALGFYIVHRDPKYWERPNEFYPEHFSPEATSRRHPFAFLPFSAGPRKCIGAKVYFNRWKITYFVLAQQYSYTLMKILLGTILLNFELECDRKVEDIKLTTDISIRPIDGYPIKIKNRIFC
jgi:cytochrome P450 family 4